jgi:hypothetical protein
VAWSSRLDGVCSITSRTPSRRVFLTPAACGSTPRSLTRASADPAKMFTSCVIAGCASLTVLGRGERRPQTARAGRTNDPFALPEALRGRGQSSEGRRWRDLARAYFA